MRTMLARGYGVLRVLLVLAIVAPGARGLCFMPGTPPGPHAGHDCCASGWTAAPAACCLEAGVEAVPAIRIAKQVVPTVSVIQAFLPLDQDSLRLSTEEPERRSSFHSPPMPVVLRV